MMPEETAQAAVDVKAKLIMPFIGEPPNWQCTPGPILLKE